MNGFPILGNEGDPIYSNPDELIDLFLNCTADGVAIIDMENRFIRVNHMYTVIFGYIEKEVIGKKFTEFQILKRLRILLNWSSSEKCTAM